MPDFTTIYLVGKGEVLSLDSGEATDKYRWMLQGYLAASEKAEIALAGITHHHADHSGNLKWLRQELKAEVIIPKHGRALLKGRLPRTGVRTLEGEDVIELGGSLRVRALAAPGHSSDSMCYYIEDEGVLFTGDTLLGSSTTVVQDLAAYRQTLKRLSELPNLKVICPGHGPLVWDPRERIRQYIEHRELRERQIVDALHRGGERTSWEIMLELYPDVHRRLRLFADYNVRAHLEQLELEGRVKVYAGRPNQPRPGKLRAQLEHAARSDSIIRQARRLEARQRRAELRSQENPPVATWDEWPRYELI